MLSWQQRIDRAKELVTVGLFRRRVPRGFTDDDRFLALDWMTCSCGMLDRRIPRNFNCKDAKNNGCPLDLELVTLGRNFYHAVHFNQLDRAEVLYRKVQERAEQLIEAIEKTGVADRVVTEL